MKQTQGKASPNLVNKLILSKIENTWTGGPPLDQTKQ
jgi:hypothetical protein